MKSNNKVLDAQVESNASRHAGMRVAQAELLIDNLPSVIFGSIFTSIVVALFLRQDVNNDYLILWLVAFLVLTTVRLLHLKFCVKGRVTVENVEQVLLQFTALSVCSGMLWGTIGFLGVSLQSPIASIVILMVLTGMVASATATMSHLLLLYTCYVSVILLPTALKFSLLGEPRYHWVAGLILFYLLVSLMSSRVIRNSILQSIKLRFANLDLLENLVIQNERTEAALLKVEQSSMAKSRFFAAASHDLRQPLHSLRLFTATLNTKINEPANREVVEHIDTSVKALEKLFNALLDISSLDAGTIKVNKQHVRLDHLLQPLVTELNNLAAEKKLAMINKIGNHTVYTDPVLLERIVRNLADNAIHYADTGSVTLLSEISGEKVCIKVMDTGKGIAEENQSQIFDEFVQLDNPERDRSRGLGLGLSIVKRVCDLLDIDLQLVSIPGKGSQFSLLTETGDSSLITETSIAPAEDVKSPIDLFVLVIDDEEEVRLAVEGLLSAWGCVVMVAGSAEEAINQLKEFGESPDILLTDYRLRSELDGGQAIQRIHDFLGIEIPAIILTGDIAPERLVEISKLNIPTLHKPCDPDMLKSLLIQLTSSP